MHAPAIPTPTSRRAQEPILRSLVKPSSWPFIGVHIAALLVFFVPFSWTYVAVAFALYAVRMFGITGGYHRYFSHRTYRTGRVFQFVLAWIGCSSVQKGPLWWAAHHRHHHQYSDEDPDLHSPGLRGFYWSHVGWILAPDYEETQYQRIPDMAKYPELLWLNRWHLVPGIALAVALFLIGGLPLLAWGFFVSTVACWHCTFMINSLTHMFGKRRYDTSDDSRNSLILALLTMGEGWHNNHHYWQASTRQGFFWWEIDLTYYTLRALQAVGVVWDIKEPPAHVVAGTKIRAAA